MELHIAHVWSYIQEDLSCTVAWRPSKRQSKCPLFAKMVEASMEDPRGVRASWVPLVPLAGMEGMEVGVRRCVFLPLAHIYFREMRDRH